MATEVPTAITSKAPSRADGKAAAWLMFMRRRQSGLPPHYRRAIGDGRAPSRSGEVPRRHSNDQRRQAVPNHMAPGPRGDGDDVETEHQSGSAVYIQEGLHGRRHRTVPCMADERSVAIDLQSTYSLSARVSSNRMYENHTCGCFRTPH